MIGPMTDRAPERDPIWPVNQRQAPVTMYDIQVSLIHELLAIPVTLTGPAEITVDSPPLLKNGGSSFDEFFL